MTRNELEVILRSSNKYSEDTIIKKLNKFDNSMEKRSKMPNRSARYSEIAKLLDITDLIDVRFYKIMNISAVVIRDYESKLTKVAFSIYRREDLLDDSKLQSTFESSEYLIIKNSNPILHPITISRDYDSCLWSARNFSNKVFYVELEGIRVSELAVYEAWVTLSKNKVVPRYCRKLNLDAHVVAISALERNRSRDQLGEFK